MTPAQARVLLEALRGWYVAQGQDEGTAFVGRTLARLPDLTPSQRRGARDSLEGAGLLMRGGFLPTWGRLLALRVGAAVHSGHALPWVRT
ncbi:hypothetical protein [Deinococcus apachensis]|uniref:hypothetical protein n=1 Tax=Deinococcus apachensis TaxID=309886 RepID=UPI0012F919EB|nr:hypothetical protein [Deinococcus apachensis]